MDPAVDAFLDHALEPAFRETAEAVRHLVAEVAPHAREQMRYGLPMWTGRGHLVYLSPNARGVLVGFPYGAAFDDPFGQLRGTAKHARHVRLRTPDSVAPEVLRYYVAAAVAYDGGPTGGADT